MSQVGMETLKVDSIGTVPFTIGTETFWHKVYRLYRVTNNRRVTELFNMHRFLNNYGISYQYLGYSKSQGQYVYYVQTICFDENITDDKDLEDGQHWQVCDTTSTVPIPYSDLQGVITQDELKRVIEELRQLPMSSHTHDKETKRKTNRFIRKSMDLLQGKNERMP